MVTKKALSPETGNAFAHGVEISGFQRLLFISGQVPEDGEGNVPPDYRSQYRLRAKVLSISRVSVRLASGRARKRA